LEITYSSTRSDQWRCTWYVVSHRPRIAFNMLLIPFLLFCWLTWRLLPLFVVLGRWDFPAALFLSLCIAVLPVVLSIHAGVVKRLPTPTFQRICTTSITPEQFQDVVPEKTYLYSWSQISDIRLHRNDFYFWVGGKSGNFIPRSAFGNPREAHLFFETAMQYWEAAKSGQTAVNLSSRNDVWPPAPRSPS